MTLDSLSSALKDAVTSGQLLKQSLQNILELLAGASTPLYLASVAELVSGGVGAGCQHDISQGKQQHGLAIMAAEHS